MSVYLQCPESYKHTQIKTLRDVLGLIWLNMLDVKNGYFGGRGSIEPIIGYGYQSADVSIFLKPVVY